MTEAGFDGRTTAIAYTSQRLFAALGVWDELADQAEPILDIRISDAGHDGRPSPLFLHFDHREAAEDEREAAPMGWIVENRFLRAALLRRLQACPQVELVAPDEALDTERGPDKVEHHAEERPAPRRPPRRLGRGPLRHDARGCRHRRARLVIRPDRDRAGGAPRAAASRRGAGEVPAGRAVRHPADDATARRASIARRSSGPRRADIAKRLLELDAPRFQAEFARRFGDYLGHVEPAGPRWSFPLGLVHAERYIDERMVLVGDAAHGIHPIAGQGYNLGVRDIAALVEVLIDAKRLGLDIGAADTLERYARWRRADNFTMVAATDLLNRLFSNDIKPLRLVRDIGLAAVNRVPPLRRFFVRHAMGLVGDLPKLIRGERP